MRQGRQIPLFEIDWTEEDIESINKVIRRSKFWTTGPNIETFEKNLSNYIGTDYCVSFNSGTSALHSVLLAYGMGEGDEIIVPSFTFIATANAPLFVGAKPVFADIEETTFGLDPASVREKINSKTKAIIPIHYAGCPCSIKELRDIAEDYNLILIEDAAESLGASIDGMRVGGFGDAAMFSFCQNKIITTGEGGCIVTNNRTLFNKLRLIRSHGRCDDINYFNSNSFTDYIQLGYNFRMSDISAALGISQLKRVDDIISLRRANSCYLNRELSKIDSSMVLIPPASYFHVYQLYIINIHHGSKTRSLLMKYLAQKGIATKVYFYPVHLTRYYKRIFHERISLPITEMISDQMLALPMYPGMKQGDIAYIINNIKEFYENLERMV